MYVEVSEALACPACGPPQGLVVLVDELDGRRVTEGRLGCSRCERRFPVRGGVAHLAVEGTPDPGDAARGEVEGRANGEMDVEADGELAVEVAALVGAPEAEGWVLLGPGLGAAAEAVAEVGGAAGIVSLGRGSPPTAPGLSRVVTGAGGSLPVLAGKLGGVALWRPSPSLVRDAARTLRPGARLALLRPSEEARRAAEESEVDLEVLASEERAWVGRRR